MPRKTNVKLQRQLPPDRRYQSPLVQRLINKSMLNGKIPMDAENYYIQSGDMKIFQQLITNL